MVTYHLSETKMKHVIKHTDSKKDIYKTKFVDKTLIVIVGDDITIKISYKKRLDDSLSTERTTPYYILVIYILVMYNEQLA